MLGLREVYDTVQPFKDPKNPTVAEIDNWNVRVIQHFRDLIGAPTKVVADRCLFLQTQWAQERKYSTIWDTKYPNGTCVGSTNAHCGAGFIPSCLDQRPYSTDGICCTRTQMSEGMFTVNADLPWSIKLTRIIGSMICTGDWAHLGPFMIRPNVGLSFACIGGSQVLRGGWNGTGVGVGCS